ncbi:MAG: arsenate reductase ArsC [Actinobacteria bacterium]|jgi:protein-tyrosine-phosphatase|nr:arsenate reductase ArsC [Actinomycetota bacterium]
MTEKGMFEFDDLQGVLSRVADRLDDSFTGIFSKETIERYVKESYDLLAVNATVTVHLPSLTERFAKDRLRALAQYETKIEKDKPSILFVCVHNAGRSQMAAALATELSSGRVEVRSAGSAPSDSIPQNVHDAMQEIGLSLEGAFPKPLTDEVVRAADVVITMGCGDACPIYPGKRYEDWSLNDPSELDLDGVKEVRNDISERISNLLKEMKVL